MNKIVVATINNRDARKIYALYALRCRVGTYKKNKINEIFNINLPY